MAKKRKRGKKSTRRQFAEHSAQHQAMMEHLIEENDPPRDRHAFPMGQSGHILHPYCWCRPEIEYQHPISFKRVYAHRLLIH